MMDFSTLMFIGAAIATLGFIQTIWKEVQRDKNEDYLRQKKK